VTGATVYNKGVHEALVRATRQGLSRRGCAGAAGVSVRTVLKWIERGKRALEAHEEGAEALVEDEKFIPLYLDLERALAEREYELLEKMDDPDEKVGMWMRHAWQLERRAPEEWGPPATRVVHEGSIEHRTTLELPEDTKKEMQALFARMTKPKELESGGG
jgi:transposase